MSHIAAVMLLAAIPYAAPAMSDPDVDLALKHAQRAILKYPTTKTAVKNLENRTLTLLDIERRTVAYLAPAYVIAKGKLDTQAISPIRFRVLDGIANPVLYYDLRTSETKASFNYNLSF